MALRLQTMKILAETRLLTMQLMANSTNRILQRNCSNEVEKDADALKKYPYCVNEVRLMGFVKKRPELIGTDFKDIVYFPMVTSNRYKIDDKWCRRTVYHKVVVKNTAIQEYALQQLEVGTKVYISGSLDVRKFKAVDEETPEAKMCIVCDNMIKISNPFFKASPLEDEVQRERIV